MSFHDVSDRNVYSQFSPYNSYPYNKYSRESKYSRDNSLENIEHNQLLLSNDSFKSPLMDSVPREKPSIISNYSGQGLTSGVSGTIIHGRGGRSEGRIYADGDSYMGANQPHPRNDDIGGFELPVKHLLPTFFDDEKEACSRDISWELSPNSNQEYSKFYRERKLSAEEDIRKKISGRIEVNEKEEIFGSRHRDIFVNRSHSMSANEGSNIARGHRRTNMRHASQLPSTIGNNYNYNREDKGNYKREYLNEAEGTVEALEEREKNIKKNIWRIKEKYLKMGDNGYRRNIPIPREEENNYLVTRSKENRNKNKITSIVERDLYSRSMRKSPMSEIRKAEEIHPFPTLKEQNPPPVPQSQIVLSTVNPTTINTSLNHTYGSGIGSAEWLAAVDPMFSGSRDQHSRRGIANTNNINSNSNNNNNIQGTNIHITQSDMEPTNQDIDFDKDNISSTKFKNIQSSIINIKTIDTEETSPHILTENNLDDSRKSIIHGEEINNTKIQEVLGPYIDKERAQFKQNSSSTDCVVFSNNLKNTMDTKYMNYCKLLKKDKDNAGKQVNRLRSGSKQKIRKSSVSASKENPNKNQNHRNIKINKSTTAFGRHISNLDKNEIMLGNKTTNNFSNVTKHYPSSHQKGVSKMGKKYRSITQLSGEELRVFMALIIRHLRRCPTLIRELDNAGYRNLVL